MSLHQFIKENVDVMVATEIAASGLAFPGVNHVINFDMPEQIDKYVQRIGRCGDSGLATTFVNRNQQSANSLLDLKLLLIECNQKVPQFLEMLKFYGDEGDECKFCGGLGHIIAEC